MADTKKKLTWTTRTFDSGVTVAVIAGAEPDEWTIEDTHRVDFKSGNISVGVTLGPGATLSPWAELSAVPDLSLDADVATTLCGRPAVKRVARKASVEAHGAFEGPSGTIEHGWVVSTAMTHVVVAGDSGNGLLELAWHVPTELRDEYSADERHFFASATCEP